MAWRGEDEVVSRAPCEFAHLIFVAGNEFLNPDVEVRAGRVLAVESLLPHGRRKCTFPISFSHRHFPEILVFDFRIRNVTVNAEMIRHLEQAIWISGRKPWTHV